MYAVEIFCFMMSGFGDDWGAWKPHPSLLEDWNNFGELCSQGPRNLEVTKLCMKILDVDPAALHEAYNGNNQDNHEAETGMDKQHSHTLTHEENFSDSYQPLSQLKSPGFPYASQSTENPDVEPLLTDLTVVLESRELPLCDDIVSSLSELPPQAYPQLFKRLEQELTESGLETLFDLACEDIHGSIEQDSWLHPGLICKYILLPKISNGGECSNRLCSVLKDFATSCPKIVMAQVLHPILTNEQSVTVHRDLIQEIISALPVEHHLYVIKYLLDKCETPVPVSKISVLTIVLGVTDIDLTPVINKLMKLLEQSATPLESNETFSDLLLIIVRRLPANAPQSVHGLLENIIRRNKSFNKQMLLNALLEKA